jgi:hypothetical protein
LVTLHAQTAAAITYIASELTPITYFGATAKAATAGSQVGSGSYLASGFKDHAILWTGDPNNPIDLHPAGFDFSAAVAVSNNYQVGFAAIEATPPFSPTYHALLWNGTAASAVDLHPPGSFYSRANAVSGNSQVGEVVYDESQSQRAVLWNGSAASAVSLHPPALTYSVATGIDGNSQVGYGSGEAEGLSRAILWHGSAASYIDLSPAGTISSSAFGVSGNTQVGDVFYPDFASHAALWTGIAASFLDLHPSGYVTSQAVAVSGGMQVGSGWLPNTDENFDNDRRALLWTGTAASALDLHPFLGTSLGIPFEYSYATGIAADGTIVGNAGLAGVEFAVMWTPFTGLAGDYNNDGFVNGADYVLWRNGGPLQNETASIGFVSQLDYSTWRSNFGNTTGSGANYGAAVPEPSAALLLIACAVGHIWQRRIFLI